MPEWNTQNRGQNRADDDSYFGDATDWDGKSCADYEALPGRAMRGVEDLTMLHGLGLQAEEDDEE